MCEKIDNNLLLEDDGYCFGCGPNNPIGLKLRFDWDPETGDYFTKFHVEKEHQGWVGRIHGGLLAVAFDEVLSRVVLKKRGYRWVTAELTTRIIKPVLIGETLLVRGRITLAKSRLTISEGEAFDSSGQLIAKGIEKMMPAPADQVAAIEPQPDR
jgi:acyl-coenzyme A thioesterase PaaI-like protein